MAIFFPRSPRGRMIEDKSKGERYRYSALEGCRHPTKPVGVWCSAKWHLLEEPRPTDHRIRTRSQQFGVFAALKNFLVYVLCGDPATERAKRCGARVLYKNAKDRRGPWMTGMSRNYSWTLVCTVDMALSGPFPACGRPVGPTLSQQR